MTLWLLFLGAILPVHPVRTPAPEDPTATSIVVSVSDSPVLLGQPVMISASVQPLFAAGSVTFYSGAMVLGVAPVSMGQAAFTTALLPAGANLLTARFDANPSFSPSLSSALTLNVGVSPGTGFPGGIINSVGTTPSGVVTADLNNDGIADLVTADAGEGAVSILLGNGDGSFQMLPDVATGINPVSVAVADFNNDGIPDLAVVNSGDPSVGILLGNGDGTFQALTPMTLGSNPLSAVVADFNDDGNADVAVVDSANNTVTLLAGNGDGTFLPGNPIGIILSPLQVTVADFNGDGEADLAIAGQNPDGVSVLLGTGDGTFSVRPLVAAGTGPTSVAAADFNGDGIPDLAVGDYGDYNSLNGGGIEILIGNGDGSFGAGVVAASGPNMIAIAAADFDGDGNLDVAAISTGGGFSTYGGNGDGTLQPPQSYPAGDSPDALAIGCFDGTGLTEVAVANQNEDELDVLTGSVGSCSYSLSPTTLLYDATGALDSVSLLVSATGCGWTLNSDAWIVPQFSSSLGSASVGFQVLENGTGYDRVGSLTVAGETVTVTQKSTSQQFSDVATPTYYFDAVNLLKNENITSGCQTDLYCPLEDVTRAQMAVFLVRGVYGGDNFTFSPVPYFTDVPPTAFGFKWIQKLFELGITSGCHGTDYCPSNPVTRAQMAVFMIRAQFGSTATFTYPQTPYFNDVPVGAFAFAWIQRMRLEGITSGCSAINYCPTNSVTRGDMAIFIMRGLFNQLYPEGTPELISVAPSVLVRGQPATFTFTGSGTNFVQGQTTISTIPLVAISNVQVLSPTSLTVELSAAETAPVQPVGLVTITGSEQDVLPNSLTIQ